MILEQFVLMVLTNIYKFALAKNQMCFRNNCIFLKIYLFLIMEKALNDLFPSVPKENVQEEPVPTGDVDTKEGNADMSLEVKEINADDDIFAKPKVSKKQYAHLAKAREKAKITRQQNALAKKAAKEKLKMETRQKRQDATAERNRQNARERYYTKKQQQDSTPPMEVVHTKQMDFDTFSDYMLRYESMKHQFKKELQNEEKAKSAKEVKKQPYHPDKYPLSHLYNPNLRSNTNFMF
jgi:hypothetical protein